MALSPYNRSSNSLAALQPFNRSTSGGLKGVLDPLGLFNKKPPPPRTPGEIKSYGYAQELGKEATQFGTAAYGRLSDLADLTDEKYFAGGKSGADFWQQDAADPKASTAAGTMTSGVRRAGALAKMGLMSNQSVDMQTLRDRVKFARFGQGIRSGQTQDLAQLSNAQNTELAARMQANQVNQAANWNLAGTVMGGLGRMAQSTWNVRQAMSGLSPVEITAQRIQT